MIEVGFVSGHAWMGLGKAPGFVSGCFESGYRFRDSAIFRNQTPLSGLGFTALDYALRVISKATSIQLW
jgi:hypothetical protein